MKSTTTYVVMLTMSLMSMLGLGEDRGDVRPDDRRLLGDVVGDRSVGPCWPPDH